MTQKRLLAFIGMPGSGKSTQIQLLRSRYGPQLEILSVPRLVKTSDFQEHLTREEQGLLAQMRPECDRARREGRLAPLAVDRILFSLAARLEEQRKCIVFDGAPRGLVQAGLYAEMLGCEAVAQTHIMLLEFGPPAWCRSLVRQVVRCRRERGLLVTLARGRRMLNKIRVYLTQTQRGVELLASLGATIHPLPALSSPEEIQQQVRSLLQALGLLATEPQSPGRLLSNPGGARQA